MTCKVTGALMVLFGLAGFVVPALGYQGQPETWVDAFGSVTPVLLKLFVIGFGMLVMKMGCDQCRPRHELARK